jgi:enoyl-CoA hydratase/carnithine racemase
MAEPTAEILVERSQSYARIIFNRPNVRNAISAAMWRDLPRLLRRLHSERAVRCIVVSGAGSKAFAAGADLGELPHFTEPRAAREYETLVVRALDSLARCPVPIVAMVRGHAVGGGCHIATACDLRVAGESARFGIPAAKLGVAVNPGVVSRLVALVGPAIAKEMLFSGQPLSARRALAVGLANHVVPDDQLEAFTLALVREIAASAPLTVRHAKQAVAWFTTEALRRPPRDIQQHFVRGFSSRDFKEGLAAFLARRAPNFMGR